MAGEPGRDRDVVKPGRDMLDPHDMRLRDLIRWLTTPARCGLYISISDFGRIGRELGIRIAPMSRYAAAEQLFRTAALDDQVDDLFDALRREFESHIHSYGEIGSPTAEPWIERATAALANWDEIWAVWREEGVGEG
jgi:hypothetical protein